MSVAQALNARTLELRKSRDEIAGGFQAVQAGAQAFAKERALKGGDAAVSDEDAQRSIQRAVKQLEDTMGLLSSGGGVDFELYKRSQRERDELNKLLPTKADDADVEREARMFILAQGPEALGGKLIGPTMAHLMQVFGASLDRGKASAIVKSAIAGG